MKSMHILKAPPSCSVRSAKVGLPWQNVLKGRGERIDGVRRSHCNSDQPVGSPG